LLRSSDDPPKDPPSGSLLRKLYIDNLSLIEKLAEKICWRHHASREEAEEFAAELKLKLLVDDYAVLRKFKGDSSLAGYLKTVTANAFIDSRNRRWGRWRPSAAAREMGPLAVRMEELLNKYGWSFDEACEILLRNDRVDVSRKVLQAIWERLPPRSVPPLPNDAGQRLKEAGFKGEQQAVRNRVRAALQQALAALPLEDRHLIRLVFLDGIKIVTISKNEGIEYKVLHHRLEKILRKLQKALEEKGIRWEQVADLLNRSEQDWGFSEPPWKSEGN
jgi:RNA polymerase sigma factor (sigma-70 family)